METKVWHVGLPAGESGNGTEFSPNTHFVPSFHFHQLSQQLRDVQWHISGCRLKKTDNNNNNNRPGIIIKNKKEKTCTLIDVAIPRDRNVVQKEAKKKLKYKNLPSLRSCTVRVDNIEFFICPTNAHNSYKIA